MSDAERFERAAAAREARAAAGHPETAGPRGRAVEVAMRRYLAAEAYQEHVTEGEAEDSGDVATIERHAHEENS